MLATSLYQWKIEHIYTWIKPELDQVYPLANPSSEVPAQSFSSKNLAMKVTSTMQKK